MEEDAGLVDDILGHQAQRVRCQVGGAEGREHAAHPDRPRGSFFEVEVAHTRGTRWYLPANGRTWLQVKARTSLGEALLEGPGPHEICVWRFTLHERELHGEDPIELQVRLAAGDTTHRVHWIAVKETSGAAPANDPAALSGIQDLKEPAADKAMSTPGAPGTERGR